MTAIHKPCNEDHTESPNFENSYIRGISGGGRPLSLFNDGKLDKSHFNPQIAITW
jgi:hypothetical protein